MKDVYVTIHTKEYGKQELTQEEWFSYDEGIVTYHREDGPAIECVNGEIWRLNGELHRLDGPAVMYANGFKAWYICDVVCTEESHKNTINKYKQLPKSIRLTHKLWWVRGL